MSIITHLETTASNLMLTDVQKISIENSIASLKTKLKDHFGSDVKEQYQFGSSTRGTMIQKRVHPKSDIDYMVVFDNSEDLKPTAFISRLKKFAESKYSTTEVFQSHPTIVLNLSNIMFELVPAYKNWLDVYKIPAPPSTLGDWISTDPLQFNKTLTDKNNNNNYKIKPLIRILKYWNAYNNYIFDSYELEQDVVDTTYFLCDNLKDYMYSYFAWVSTWNLPQYKCDKIDRARKIIEKAKELESNGNTYYAEEEIKKLIPPY
jgi:predicted nucleotidyltransferase